MTRMPIFHAAAIAAALLFNTASAQVHDHADGQRADVAVANAAHSSGEIKKIDKAAGKLTIAHGPLVNLNMPGMTMTFKVQDPAVLDRVKVGDKISFVADRVNGAFVATNVQATN